MKEKIGKFDSKKSKKKSENLRQKMKEKKGNLTAKNERSNREMRQKIFRLGNKRTRD